MQGTCDMRTHGPQCLVVPSSSLQPASALNTRTTHLYARTRNTIAVRFSRFSRPLLTLRSSFPLEIEVVGARTPSAHSPAADAPT